MPKAHLTKSFIDQLAPCAKDAIYWDDSLSGFGLKVTPKGRKVFLVLYRTRDGFHKLRKYTIGPYGQLTLVIARQAAQKVLAARLDGKDPAAEKRQLRRKIIRDSVNDVMAEYCLRHVDSTRSAKETRRVMDREILPRWSGRSIHDIGKHDVLKLLDEIVDRGSPGMANSVFSDVRTFFNWAVGRGLIDKSPCAGLSKPSVERSRDRVLTDDELSAVILAAHKMGHPYGMIVELLALTAQRRQEVSGLSWAELDLEGAVWTIPGSRAKNAKAHIVHLAPRAVQILRGIERTDDLLFANRTEKPFNDFSGGKFQLDLASGVTGWVLHDLRRTAVSGMARLGVPPHVADRILNHRTGTIAGVAAVYQRHEFVEERKEALNRWAAHIQLLTINRVASRAA